MNENMAAFIHYLRTTDKPQGTGRLRGPEGFCCLGIACEAAIEAGLPGLKRAIGAFSYESSHCCDRCEGLPKIENSTLPHNVMDWLGLNDTNPNLSVPQHVIDALSEEQIFHVGRSSAPSWTAAGLNDTPRLTFPQIADCFEATFGDEQVAQ